MWHYLRQGRVRSSRRTAEQLERGRDARRAIDRISSGDAGAAARALCPWCEYRAQLSRPSPDAARPERERVGRPDLEPTRGRAWASLSLGCRHGPPRRAHSPPARQLHLPARLRGDRRGGGRRRAGGRAGARRVDALGARVAKILSTHHHPDHSMANPELAKRYGAPVYGHVATRAAARASPRARGGRHVTVGRERRASSSSRRTRAGTSPTSSTARCSAATRCSPRAAGASSRARPR